MQSLDNDFERVFQGSVRSGLIDALYRTYETACEHYEPTRGNNGLTFGVEVYNCAVHELCEQAKRSEDNISIISRTPLFRMGIDKFEVACHRVGRKASDDIWTSYPSNECAAVTTAESQLWLPGISPTTDWFKKVILAHMGNPEDGFAAAYLCIPRRISGNQIEWTYAHRLWKKQEASIPCAVLTTHQYPPEETIENVMPSLKNEQLIKKQNG